MDLKFEERLLITEACHGVLWPSVSTVKEILTGNVALKINRYQAAERHGVDGAAFVSKLAAFSEEQCQEVLAAGLAFWRGEEGESPVLGSFQEVFRGLAALGIVSARHVR